MTLWVNVQLRSIPPRTGFRLVSQKLGKRKRVGPGEGGTNGEKTS